MQIVTGVKPVREINQQAYWELDRQPSLINLNEEILIGLVSGEQNLIFYYSFFICTGRYCDAFTLTITSRVPHQIENRNY